MKPTYEELIVRPDADGVGVVYVGKELVGYRVLLVPLEPIDEAWAHDARGEQ